MCVCWQEWEKCKAILNPNGNRKERGLMTRLDFFDVERFKTEPYNAIAARAHEFVRHLDFDRDVRKTSPAATTLYIWVSDVIAHCSHRADAI